MKNLNDHIGTQTRNLVAFSAVPQPTVPLHTEEKVEVITHLGWRLKWVNWIRSFLCFSLTRKSKCCNTSVHVFITCTSVIWRTEVMFLRASLTTTLISRVGYAVMWARVCNYAKKKKSFSTLTEFCTHVLNWAQRTQAQNLVQIFVLIYSKTSVRVFLNNKNLHLHVHSKKCIFKLRYNQLLNFKLRITTWS